MKFVVSIVTLVTTGALAWAQDPISSTRENFETEEQRVLAAEDEYVAAEVARDEKAMRRLVDDRFVLNSVNGTTSGKEELIRFVLAANMTGQTVSERSVTMEGPLAIIFGTTALRFQDPGKEERVSEYRYTSVYVRRTDGWRMLALQMQPRSSR